MSAVAGPFGMRPIWNTQGQIRPQFMKLTKALMEATPTLFQNQCVLLDATGRLAAAAAGAGSLMVGVFQGVEYTDLASGRPVVSNQWVNGTLVRDFGTDSARVYYTRDPYIQYEIQANAPLAAAAYGEEASIVNPNAGNTVTGLSTTALDAATSAAALDQLRIMNLALYPDNDWGDAFTIVQVLIAQHQEIAAIAGI